MRRMRSPPHDYKKTDQNMAILDYTRRLIQHGKEPSL